MSEGIYSVSMSFNFLLQATRVLSLNNYDEDELKMVYEFMIGLDGDKFIMIEKIELVD